MSLSKQLLILVTLIFFIVFAVNFTLSMGNIRSYLQVESEIHMQDTATSLGLSLSPHMTDEQDPILRTMMNAIFDTGYYKEMRLVNVDGDTLVVLSNPEQIDGVPNWLIDMLPLRTATAVSEISSGWNISGTLSVTSNPGYGYLKLYQQFKSTLKYSLLIFLAAIVLLVAVLRLTLKPLKDIQKQANEISAGNFVTIDKMPWTREVKNVAQSMNSMSGKIGGMIARLNSKLENLSDSLKRDALTGLLNQQTFTVDVKTALSGGQSGHILYIKFDDLAGIGRDKGKQAVDQLLMDFADMLKQQTSGKVQSYRLYGSEFAIVYTGSDQAKITSFANDLKQSINNLGQQYDDEDLLHIGIVGFGRSSDFDQLLPAAIEAYEQAKLVGTNAYAIKADSVSSISEQAWKAAISHAIDNNTPEITFTNQAYNYNGDSPVQVMMEAFTVVRGENGKELPIGTFFSMAEEFGLVEQLDRTIVNKILTTMEEHKVSCPVTINLSMKSVASKDFHEWLRERLEQFKLPTNLLAFSVTAYAAAKGEATFARFSQFVRDLGATTLLKRYSSDVIPVERIKELHINYIRLARDLTTDIRQHTSKPDFLDIIQEVANLLEIKVLAEGVSNDGDFEYVQQANLFGVSR
ncbi:LapD/MoxY N-terminal periplasmic domain-containing protein [Methylophaga sp. OBS3]|uniref:bifunctional diguanylate cyclase/phosphodiesterase n=1 Tax=Methylophaga sp. OBS3 TaxID=2991934 RepID=UPI002252CF24|nr:LapD/MoxY N-terminal periplasmic domain-containing protein [Methylophaga sp. OBS3]MCX4189223.1 EAL domain-containing protein [Methylophaga sp. OBS3]